MASIRAGEFDLIDQYFRPLARSDAARNLSDDAAVLRPIDGHSFVVTVDTVTEGIHFLPNTNPEDIAQKALRVNLSDLAAMAANPLGYTLALSLSEEIDEPWLAAFTKGLKYDQDTFGLTLLGGDTTSTPGPVSLSITMFGQVLTGKAVPRSGAQIGDAILVTGTIGDSALGLLMETGQGPTLAADLRSALVERYRRPVPRLGILATLNGRAHAAADISDGLIADAGHIAEASGVKIQLEADRVPMSNAAQAALNADAALLETILTGGDDYELIFAVPPQDVAFTKNCGNDSGVPITQIGQVVAGSGVTVSGPSGRDLVFTRFGYQHR